MQKWEYLQLSYSNEPLWLEGHALHARWVWIDSRGGLGPLGWQKLQVKALDRGGQEKTAEVVGAGLDWSQLLDELGEEGWELVSAHGRAGEYPSAK